MSGYVCPECYDNLDNRGVCPSCGYFDNGTSIRAMNNFKYKKIKPSEVKKLEKVKC
jgi:hypothetical protein